MRHWLVCLCLLVSCGGDEDHGDPSTTTSAAATTTVDTEPPPSDPSPKDYIQWTCAPIKTNCESRFSWAKRVDLAYSVWRGERDLEFLLNNPQYIKEYTDLNEVELLLIIGRMRKENYEGDRLIWRIENEKHRNFDPDPLGDWHRSQVRKSVANEMIERLQKQTSIYSGIASQFPEVPGCDNIKCKIGKL